MRTRTQNNVTSAGRLESRSNGNTTIHLQMGKLHKECVRAFHNIKATSEAANEAILDIAFHRIVRVPDNDNTYGLLPDLGEFPIYSVQDFSETLQVNMVAKGGVVIPMYGESTFLLQLSFSSIQFGEQSH
jgi:hypothetical protein